jgi:hypothetical protein
MKRDRAMIIHFMDGTNVSFTFPAQQANSFGSTLLIEELVQSPFVLVEAEGALLMYPVTNIKSIQLTNLTGEEQAVTPKGLIRGASVAR